MFYSARRAQEAADAELSGSRSGIDETEEGAADELAAIRDGLARGLSPQQIAAGTPGPSASTVYRWVGFRNRSASFVSNFSDTYSLPQLLRRSWFVPGSSNINFLAQVKR